MIALPIGGSDFIAGQGHDDQLGAKNLVGAVGDTVKLVHHLVEGLGHLTQFVVGGYYYTLRVEAGPLGKVAACHRLDNAGEVGQGRGCEVAGVFGRSSRSSSWMWKASLVAPPTNA